MNLKLAALLAAVALLVGLVLYLGSGGRDSAARGPREGVAHAQPAPEAPAPAVESAPAPAPAPVEVAREKAGPAIDLAARGSWRGELAGLIGRVVESDGKPVPGMRVALIEVDTSLLFDGSAIEADEPALELEESVTDAEGRFVLSGAHAPSIHALGVDLGGPRATVRVLDHALTHGQRTDVGDIVLAPFGVLTGRVVDESGAPVGGARVRAARLPKEILAGTPYEFRSDSLIAVNLTPMGGNGQWIIELPSWIRSELERLPVPTTYSAADGTFRLEGVPLAEVVGGADKRGYVGAPIGPVDVSGGLKALGDLVLKHGRTVRGVVEDSSGDPVPDVEVAAGAELVAGAVAILQPCGRTDAEGRFQLAGVSDTGQVVAAARRAPHERWSTTVTTRFENVTVEVETTVKLIVNVHDQKGDPLSGARIQLVPTRQFGRDMGFDEVLSFLPRPPSPAGTFREFEPGRYVIERLGAGVYDVTARVAGLAPGFLETECRREENECTLTCTPGNHVDLQVIDAVTKAPVSGARASVLHVGSPGFAKLVVATTDADGRAQLGPLPTAVPVEAGMGFLPPQNLLQVQHPHYGDHSAELDEHVSPLVVALESGGTLAGRVHWGGAVPTRLYMLVLQYRGADGFLEAFHMPSFTVTDLAGEFRVSNLLPGKYNTELSERFLDQDPLGMMNDEFHVTTLHQEEVEIRNGETTELVIDLTPTGRGETARVVGRVRVFGHPVAGAEVEIRGNERVKVATDSSGRFETAPFSIQGSAWVRIEGDVELADGRKRHQQLYQESVKLAADEVREIDLDLYPLTLSVKVVALSSGEPVPDANVSSRAKEEKGWRPEDSTQGNAQGEVEVLVLQPGDYVLTANAEGFGATSLDVTVPAEGLAQPALLRMPRAVPCAGRVQVDSTLPARTRFAYMQVSAVEGSAQSGTMLTGDDHTFEIDGLAEGKYRYWIYYGGQRSEEGTFELGSDGSRELVLDFVPAKE